MQLKKLQRTYQKKKATTLAIAFFFSLFFLPFNFVKATTNTFVYTWFSSTTPNYIFQGGEIDWTNTIAPSACYLYTNLYKGNYPDTSNNRASSGGGSSPCTTNGTSTFSATYPLASFDAGDGNYWILKKLTTDVGGTIIVHSYYTNAYKNGSTISTIPYSSISTTTSITLLTPTPQTFLGNNIEVTGRYTNTQTYNQILWNVQNLSLGSTINISSSSIALANGTFNFSKILILPYAGNYSVQTRLYDSTTGSTTNSNTLFFAIASTTPTQVIVDEIMASTTSFLDFLNVPELMREKKPFGYLWYAYDIGTELVDTYADYSTTTTYGVVLDLNAKWGGQSATTTNMYLEGFSTSTLTWGGLLTDVVSLLRFIEVILIYSGLGYAIYKYGKWVLSYL